MLMTRLSLLYVINLLYEIPNKYCRRYVYQIFTILLIYNEKNHLINIIDNTISHLQRNKTNNNKKNNYLHYFSNNQTFLRPRSKNYPSTLNQTSAIKTWKPWAHPISRRNKLNESRVLNAHILVARIDHLSARARSYTLVPEIIRQIGVVPSSAHALLARSLAP